MVTDTVNYVENITTPKARFSVYQIPGPDTTHKELVDIKITVYYTGQVVNCRRCLSEEHEAKNCGKAKRPAYNPDLEIFRGHKNSLSNFYETPITMDEQHYSSGEQFYQFMRAVYNDQWDAANKIREDKTGREAQITGDTIEATNILDSWEEDQDTVMKTMFCAKLEQCEVFKRKLLSTGTKVLVEATRDTHTGVLACYPRIQQLPPEKIGREKTSWVKCS